jgi:Tfp pilus assembly protein PilV
MMGLKRTSGKTLDHYSEKSSEAGFNMLDLLITLLVLAIILLAAVKQFGGYERFADRPAPQGQSVTTAPSP